MKTKNLIKTTAGLFVAGVLSTVVVACGGGGGSNAQPANPYGYGNCVNCQNINGATPFFRAQSQDSYGVVTINWNFSGQSSQVPNQPYYGQPVAQPVYGGGYAGGYNGGYGMGYGFQAGYGYGVGYGNGYGGMGYGAGYGTGYGMGAVTNYSGPVAVNGQLMVMQGMSLGYCQLPGGTYTLGTLQAGQWSMGIVSNLRMQATGPASIVLTMTNGQVSAKTGYQLGSTWDEAGNVGRIFGNLFIESVNGYNCQMSLLVQ